MDWTAVIFAIISAAIYGVIFYAKAWVYAEEPKPPFDPHKFAATIIVSILIGFVAGMSGAPLTEADFLVQLGAYAGYVAMLETLLKALFALFEKKWPSKYPNS